MMSNPHDALWAQRHDALYRAELSSLYHRSRERFFDGCDKAAKAVAIIGGSAAFATLGVSVQIAAAAITITSTLALVYGLTERARRHADLAAQFGRLEAEIVARGEHAFTAEDVTRWAAQVRQLETGEPATLWALTTLCQNRIAVAQAHPEQVVALPWYQRAFAHVMDFAPAGALQKT
jgi:hypothetical protein